MFTIYYADFIGVANNCLYPHKVEVNNIEDLKRAVSRDYVCASYKNNYRNNRNFIASNCLPVDCDNDHSENPTDWITPDDVKNRIEEQASVMAGKVPQNLEEQAISLVGQDIYELLVKGYTEKQWGKQCKDLPPEIIKRLPVRLTFDNNYFNDKYQGIPIGGYTQIIEKMLEGCDIQLSTDFFDDKEKWLEMADKIIYTGTIDKYFDYEFGELEYRSLRFESDKLDVSNFQGNAVINYTEAEIPYTRIIEHKHFEFGTQPTTIVTREYPATWKQGDEPYYAVNDEKNTKLYAKYKELADKQDKVIFGGRLGMYKYFDMDDTIMAAWDIAKEIIK